jgi:hypothetical protein
VFAAPQHLPEVLEGTAMKLKLLAAASLLSLAPLANAITTYVTAAYTVTYDETTAGFGFISSSFTAGGNLVGFEWSVQPAVQVSASGGSASASFALPDFTISVNPGYALSGGLTGSLGQITYAEFGAASTTLSAAATVMVDALPATVLPMTALTKTSSSATTGWFADLATAPLGGFSSFGVSAASIQLDATAAQGSFAAIIGQTQNKLAFTFFAQEVSDPVPEPETYALLLAGLGVMGWIVRRRQR